MSILAIGGTTVRDFVIGDIRASEVFERYGIDFYTKGERSLEQACRERGIDHTILEREIGEVCASVEQATPHFAEWDIEFLIEYLEQNHHRYVRDITPGLLSYLQAAVRQCGQGEEVVGRVHDLFLELAGDLELHMQREEQVLFPYIRALSAARNEGSTMKRPSFGRVRDPITFMMGEHFQSASMMSTIRRLTGDYRVPEQACLFYRVALGQLADFERDLHRHEHLENNILFSKAIALEAEVFGMHFQGSMRIQ